MVKEKKDDVSIWYIIKNSVPLIILILLFISLYFWPGYVNNKLNEECYQYTNSTSGVRYISGKCYITQYDYYETKNVCNGGILGVGQSCYESSETHYESYKYSICIVAKTGEKC